MQMPTRAPRLEWNLNTIISLVTLVGMCVGLVTIWVDKTRDIEDLQMWRVNHEQLHKERLAEVAGLAGRSEERFRAIERDIQKIDRLEYRLTNTEQTTSNTAASIRELQTLVSQQAGDIKVVREILQRLEASDQKRSR